MEKQKAAKCRTCESDDVALAVWWSVRYHKHPYAWPQVYEDDQGTVALAKDPVRRHSVDVM